MNDKYEIFEFRFVDRGTKQGAVIYARTEATAQSLVDIWNSFQSIYHWVKPKFRFKKRFLTSVPPYELEQEQENTILQMKERFKK